MNEIGTRLRACISGIKVDSRCSSGNSVESGNVVGAVLAGYDGEISYLLIWHNMPTDRHVRQLPSVSREHLTDGSSFVYFFLWHRHLKEAEDERLRE